MHIACFSVFSDDAVLQVVLFVVVYRVLYSICYLFPVIRMHQPVKNIFAYFYFSRRQSEYPIGFIRPSVWWGIFTVGQAGFPTANMRYTLRSFQLRLTLAEFVFCFYFFGHIIYQHHACDVAFEMYLIGAYFCKYDRAVFFQVFPGAVVIKSPVHRPVQVDETALFFIWPYIHGTHRQELFLAVSVMSYSSIVYIQKIKGGVAHYPHRDRAVFKEVPVLLLTFY